MLIRLWGSGEQVSELLEKGMGDHKLVINETEGPESGENYDLFIDLDPDEKKVPAHLGPEVRGKPYMVSAVCRSVSEVAGQGAWLIGLNAWPGFLRGRIAELSLSDRAGASRLTSLMRALGWEFVLTEDMPGLVTPRIISMIINEAYFAAADGTATPRDIDIALKLGANYPLGPFEWADKIGLKRVLGLLQKLYEHSKDPRYIPAPLLVEASQKAIASFPA
jgi:3-hydroxybutyryl-CoA dehydrogenase